MADFGGYNYKPAQAPKKPGAPGLKMHAFSILGKAAVFWAVIGVLLFLYSGR